LVAAACLVLLGRRDGDQASALHRANSAAIARNRTLSAQLSETTAADSRARKRVDLIDGDGQSTLTSIDGVVRAWNEWLAANNTMIETANRFVDHSTPPRSAIRTDLDPQLRTVSDKESAFQAALVKFVASAAKARRDVAAGKP
jgi:hypothetical protein